MTKIFLIGYMGAGKTTIGQNLARRLNLQFVDTDKYIESRYRKKINQIFAERGEEEFREMERKILQEVTQFENVVISTGGGTPCFFDNMQWMNQHGQTVYLKVAVEELAHRLNICKQNRPLIKDKNPDEIRQFVAENLLQREVCYNLAHIIYPAGEWQHCKNAEQQTEKLLHLLNTEI
ncbi:MAG: Shikimate kinase [Candidatus Ordinivivax streblomastigis]|uniref:Shikimate kinase n=1 Tax=Candidatus Ordinivivax streblomastigis TaxID=2540710 RepID=A0A5M8P1V7_9BACT|nr:MAG: Shikimate kinase [Candidatus Ordinivivax streblomastigis]